MNLDQLNQTFGIIRSLLNKPSSHSWKRLCGYLDRFESRWHEPEIQERVVYYIKRVLQTWPDDVLRYAQHLWITRALRGEQVPQLEMATAMQFISQDASEDDIALLFHNPLLENMRHIDLRAACVGRAGTNAIIDNPWLEKLQVLDVRHAGVHYVQVERLRERFMDTECQVVWR